jgi:hypothetical protein
MNLHADLTARWPRLHRLIADVEGLTEDAARRRWLLAPATSGTVNAAPRSPGLQPGRGKGTISDPTGDAVLNALAGRETDATRFIDDAIDRAQQEIHGALLADTEARARDHLRDAKDILGRAVGVGDQALPDPGTIRRIRLDALGDPGCYSCRRIRDSQGRPWYSPTAKKTKGRNGLCRWCDDWRRTFGNLPPIPLLEMHRDGKRLTPKAIAGAIRKTATVPLPRQQPKRNQRP